MACFLRSPVGQASPPPERHLRLPFLLPRVSQESRGESREPPFRANSYKSTRAPGSAAAAAAAGPLGPSWRALGSAPSPPLTNVPAPAQLRLPGLTPTSPGPPQERLLRGPKARGGLLLALLGPRAQACVARQMLCSDWPPWVTCPLWRREQWPPEARGRRAGAGSRGRVRCCSAAGGG